MLKPLAPQDARRLRRFLSEARYTFEDFRRTPELRELPSLRSGNLPLLLHRTREVSALTVLLRTFFMGHSVDGDAFRASIPAPEVALMLESGMLIEIDGRFTPTVMLTPVEEFLFAADSVTRMQSANAGDVVLWPNPTTDLLRRFALREPSRATLDLGGGCGVQAVLASGYSSEICATDLNPRAEEFGRFNAALNEVRKIEFLTGDTFEPVQGRRFDSILANPPFFVTPTSAQLYCENSMELDQYCRRVVREAPGYLNEGGFLQMVFEWVQIDGQPWRDRLFEWLEGTGCDAWVLETYSRDAASYAHERSRTIWAAESADESDRFDGLTEHYRSLGVTEIHGGLLAMRRRSGRNWIRIEAMPAGPSDAFGDSIRNAFANQDALDTHQTDEQLVTLKPRLSPDAALENRSLQEGGIWKTVSLKLSLTRGVPASVAVEPAVGEFIGRADGSHTLEELVLELAANVNADPAEVRSQCCAAVRKLAERRLVLL